MGISRIAENRSVAIQCIKMPADDYEKLKELLDIHGIMSRVIRTHGHTNLVTVEMCNPWMEALLSCSEDSKLLARDALDSARFAIKMGTWWHE